MKLTPKSVLNISREELLKSRKVINIYAMIEVCDPQAGRDQ
jgi:hypothetical protein